MFILSVAIPIPLNSLFDYVMPASHPAEFYQKGMRVLLPFGKKIRIGIIVEKKLISDIGVEKLKKVLAHIDEVPLLSPALLELIEWASDYYHYPLGECYATALPNGFFKLKAMQPWLCSAKLAKLSAMPSEEKQCILDESPYTLNLAQAYAVEEITASLGQFKVFLMNGVTGSGKTEVYLRLITEVLSRNQQVLVLLPEIGLMPQTVLRFQQRFPESVIALFHSGLTEKVRLKAWIMARDGKAQILIGTRSALFLPLFNPGLIIVDEEHDLSFKQQEGLRYNARDLAVRRGQLEHIPVLLGSASCSLESYMNVQKERYQLLTLDRRAGTAQTPLVKLMDLRNQPLVDGICEGLRIEIQKHLAQEGQVLLFLNRRGFANVYLCHYCDWVAECKRCDKKMTYHRSPPHLQCHYCGKMEKIPKSCPQCHQTQLIAIGVGTQRLEERLQEFYPDTEIIRIDSDNTRKKTAWALIYERIKQGKNQILIGTQMLAKGHHLPNVTLVGILEADNGLFSPDFRSIERTAQLLTQVAGRAGRAERKGEVIIQTHHLHHFFFQEFLTKDYLSFLQMILNERREAHLPPYTYWALLRAESIIPDDSISFLKEIKKKLLLENISFLLLGPVPSLMPRRANYYRFQLLFQANERNILHGVLRNLQKIISKEPSAKKTRWALDVDPLELG